MSGLGSAFAVPVGAPIAGPHALDEAMPAREPQLTARVLESLSGFSDETLEQVTRDSSIHVDGRWLRMLDSLDLAPLLGGEVTLRFVAVMAGEELAALCPFIVTRSPTVYSMYSFDKYYFTAWQDEFLSLNPDKARLAGWLSKAVAAWRWFANKTGAGTRGWVLGVSPLSHHFDVAVAPRMAHRQPAILAQAIEALQDVAREEDLPLGIFGLRDEQTALRGALRDKSFDELFLAYDNMVPLPEGDFEQYLGGLNKRLRHNIRGEMRRVQAAGVRFEVLAGSTAGLGGEMEALYEAMYSQYPTERFRYDAGFWKGLAGHLGDRLEIVLARRGDDRPIGFAALLRKGEDLYAWSGGRSTEGELAQLPLYFSLAFYEPVKRALGTGARRLCMGFGCGDAKMRRGAEPRACHHHVWFPRAWQRGALLPYLRMFSAISRQDQVAALPDGLSARRVGTAEVLGKGDTSGN